MSLQGRDEKVVKLALDIKDKIDKNAKPKIFHLSPIKRLNQNSEPEIIELQEVTKEINLVKPIYMKITKKAELTTSKVLIEELPPQITPKKAESPFKKPREDKKIDD